MNGRRRTPRVRSYTRTGVPRVRAVTDLRCGITQWLALSCMFLFSTSLALAQDPIPEGSDVPVVQTKQVTAPTSYADRIIRNKLRNISFSIGATETYSSDLQGTIPLRLTTFTSSIF